MRGQRVEGARSRLRAVSWCLCGLAALAPGAAQAQPDPDAEAASARSLDEILDTPGRQRTAAEVAALWAEGRRLWREEAARRPAKRAPAKVRGRGPSRVVVSVPTRRCANFGDGTRCADIPREREVEIPDDPTFALCYPLYGERDRLAMDRDQGGLAVLFAQPNDVPTPEERADLRRAEILEYEVAACQEQAWQEHEAALRAAGDRCAHFAGIVDQHRAAQVVGSRYEAAERALGQCRAIAQPGVSDEEVTAAMASYAVVEDECAAAEAALRAAWRDPRAVCDGVPGCEVVEHRRELFDRRREACSRVFGPTPPP